MVSGMAPILALRGRASHALSRSPSWRSCSRDWSGVRRRFPASRGRGLAAFGLAAVFAEGFAGRGRGCRRCGLRRRPPTDSRCFGGHSRCPGCGLHRSHLRGSGWHSFGGCTSAGDCGGFGECFTLCRGVLLRGLGYQLVRTLVGDVQQRADVTERQSGVVQCCGGLADLDCRKVAEHVCLFGELAGRLRPAGR